MKINYPVIKDQHRPWSQEELHSTISTEHRNTTSGTPDFVRQRKETLTRYIEACVKRVRITIIQEEMSSNDFSRFGG
uniref:SFRICE_025554 n=1 Tax=Spodoptera frugiperda TaxID=7108 RepID=A0A2H1WCH4_SPOFR